MRRNALNTLFILLAFALVAGCGFKLRGQVPLPFASIYVEAGSGSSLGDGLKQAIRGQGKLAEKAEGAALRIKVLSESREKTILTLSASSRVREYRLSYRVSYTAEDATARVLVAPTTLNLTRDFTYDDTQVLAKEGEETALNRTMAQDALRQVLAQLSYLKP